MEKDFWKFMMYAKPQWYFFGKSGVSKAAKEAADEYEEEMPYILGGIAILVVVGLAVFGLLTLFGVV